MTLAKTVQTTIMCSSGDAKEDEVNDGSHGWEEEGNNADDHPQTLEECVEAMGWWCVAAAT